VAVIIAFVNERRDIILYAVIKWPKNEICQFMSNIIGVTADLLCNGISLRVVQDCLCRILPNNTLVGCDLQNDLKSLLYSHDLDLCEDLQEYFRDGNNQPYGLSTLAREIVGKDHFQSAVHSAINDARMTQKLHVKKLEYQLADAKKSSRKLMDLCRTVPSKSLDKCKCKKK
jgi:hypothetical protein